MLLIDAIRATWPDLEWTNFVVAFVTIAVTYTIFAMMGFGSALIAAPVLALRIPLTSVVPLLAVLDLTAALVNIGATLAARSTEARFCDWRRLWHVAAQPAYFFCSAPRPG